ncbi:MULTISPECIES: amidohydrolase [unclassified Burkholderia]|uniref:amidohydrolase family protein n=1 Tax=unclassified Burkholderia TaxID=2613784 RepID=UPI000F5815FB|nr:MULTISPECIES: amidohydrolase family protein [unclassified Burkholderia]RQR70962.1 GntR family transcriptional regulator [Burkholderia sp. Bp9011]RQR83725.1 GntR family transcriptional regulator [Burkholderia sp. Bp9010]RQS64426.1 GntR family transcriptional regulator [Burkholderia sp. Bp8977]
MNEPIATDASLPCAPAQDVITRPSFDVPFGAVDTHAHVISGHHEHPMVAARSYTPPPAPEEKYLTMLDMLGMTYGVLVQISVYGTDNRYMLDVLRRNPNRLRGIAVVSPDIGDSELETLHAAGVRGLRINVLFGGGIGFDAMERLAHRIKPFGWHMQFLMDARTLPELMPRMATLPVPGVIDHMGHMPVSDGLDTPGVTALRRLVVDHGYWVKLSGAYRISERFETFDDVVPIARMLINDAPERMVWGSDWPHVSQSRTPDTGRLLGLLAEWAPAADVRHQILVSNPACLYGF